MLVFVVYKDKTNQFRWNLWTANNRIIADSAESYVNKADAVAMVRKIMADAGLAQVQDHTQNV